MTIRDVEFYLVQVECEAREAPLRSLLVRLSTDQGLEGWGEAHLGWRSSELAARRDALLPILAGRSIFDVEDLLELEPLQPAPLRAALEMASWDLIGWITRQPLCHLFGGRYRSRIPLAVRLPDGKADRVARLARELADRGFHSQVLTLQGRLESDLQMVAAVREGAGERIELRLDAAQRYDMETARDLCAEIESAGVQFVVDPLRDGDLDQIASLRRQVEVPLGVWRSIRGPADVLALVRCGAAPFAVVDLQRVGGIAPARQCAAIARAAGLAASLGGGPSTGVGVAAMLHVAASTPAFAGCNECASYQLEDDLLANPLEVLDGMLTVPQGAGLGVEVDRARLETYQVG